MKKYKITFNLLKSSYFHLCSENCQLVYARKGKTLAFQFLQFGIAVASDTLSSFYVGFMPP